VSKVAEESTVEPQTIAVSIPLLRENTAGQEAGTPAPVEAISRTESTPDIVYESDREFRLLSPEGIAYGSIVLFIGLTMCFCELLRGIGGNIIAAGLLVLLANGFDKARKQPRIARAVEQLRSKL
jgi:hypothetical protein